MSEEDPLPRSLSIASLGETRRFVREAHSRMAVAFFAIVYAIGSMALGGMIVLARVPGGYTSEVLWGNALGTGSWNYPGLLIVAPWGVVSLPFLATLSMGVVSIGVGIGVTVALLITVRLIRDRRRGATGAGGVGTIAGLTPAMIALVTLGACCSTTAAATAGVGLVAQASGSTLDNLLVNNWYLDLFQISIVYVALLAQELILRVYGGLLGLAGAPAPTTVPARPDAAVVGATALRAALLLAGTTWSLAMFADWAAGSAPSLDSGALWFQWIVQHQFLAVFAILIALLPLWMATGYARSSAAARVALRAALLVAGFSLAVWTPPALAAGGAPGFLNELFGVWGLPSSWGAVAPVFPLGAALYGRWLFQYLLLGGFAIAVAARPSLVLGAVSHRSRAEPIPSERSGAVDGSADGDAARWGGREPTPNGPLGVASPSAGAAIAGRDP